MAVVLGTHILAQLVALVARPIHSAVLRRNANGNILRQQTFVLRS